MTPPTPGTPDTTLPPLYARTKLVRDGVIAGCCIAWMAARSAFGLSLSFIDAIFVLSVIAVLASYAAWRRRLRRCFRENEGKLCTHCGHSLIGLAETGLCPECGKTFNLTADHAAWMRTELFARPSRD